MKYTYFFPARLFLCVMLFVNVIAFSQNNDELGYDIDVRQSKARFDFYEGVSLLNSGNIAESLIAFQRAVAVDGDNLLMKYWLSRASYAYGQDQLSQNILKNLVGQKFQESYLLSQIELENFIHQRTGVLNNFSSNSITNFVRAVSLNVLDLGYKLPMSVRMLQNNTMMLSSLGSNTVSILSPTGQVLQEIQKDVARLGRPTDSLTLSDYSILVTEFLIDNIYKFSPEGSPLGSFIKEPIPPALKGPQFLAKDRSSNIYVSAYGSAKILKFNTSGEFLFDFGGKTTVYDGLTGPTGIAVVDESVWVLDNTSIKMYITEFDTSGNFINRFGIDNIRGEGLRAYDDILLISTTNKVMRFNTKRASIIDVLSDSDFIKLTSAEFDNNDMLWVVDQERGRVEAFSEPTNQYAGLFTKAMSIRTDNFPTVQVRMSVKSSSGSPVVGLKAKDFVVFEDNETVNTKKVLEDTSVEQGTNTIIIPIPINIELAQNLSNKQAEKQVMQNRIIESANFLISAMNSQSVADVAANTTVFPQKLWVAKSGLNAGYEVEEVSASPLVVQAVTNSLTKDINKDNTLVSQERALRLAINTLLPLAGKKSIVFLGDGLHPNIFDRSIWKQMMKIAQYYSVDIVWVSARDKETIMARNDESIKLFLTELHNISMQISNENMRSNFNIYDSPNVFYYPYIIKEVTPNLLDRLQRPLSGVYSIVFESKYNKTRASDNGQYVGLSIESYYFTRSGKDVAGYVIPIQR